jgi:hypothetical protein
LRAFVACWTRLNWARCFAEETAHAFLKIIENLLAGIHAWRNVTNWKAKPHSQTWSLQKG